MSNSPKVERKLAAIMFTDIAGFTESMSYDENEAITAVKKKRSIIQPLIKEHNGVFVKEIGDGTLSYFSSAIDASTCAVNLQQSTYDEEHLNIRVGLHIGDIVFDGDLDGLINDWALASPIPELRDRGGNPSWTADWNWAQPAAETANEGILLKGTDGTVHVFHSSEAENPELRPKLIVTYEPRRISP